MTLRELNKERSKTQPWNYEPNGTPKQYVADKEKMRCPQSEMADQYGTPHEITNAIFYSYERLETDIFSDSLALLLWIQRGVADDKIKHLAITKPKLREIGTEQEIANAVHHYIDWLRACVKRKWDTRPMNPKKQMLEICLKGMYINDATELHYDEAKRGY